MMKTIESKGLTAGSLFKLLFLGLLIPALVFWISVGLGSFLGHDVLKINQEYIYGVKGLLAAMALGVVMPMVLSAILTLFMGFGLWLITRFKTIQLNVKQ